jgi:CheY-like chemotaxis protein
MNATPPNGNAIRVLVVDQDKHRRETLIDMLLSDGFQTHAVTNRHETLDVMEEQSFDLIIMNVHGTEAIGTIIAIRAYEPETRIIAISGGPSAQGFLPLAKSLGASGLIGDSLDQGRLRNAIHNVLAPDLKQLAS